MSQMTNLYETPVVAAYMMVDDEPNERGYHRCAVRGVTYMVAEFSDGTARTMVKSCRTVAELYSRTAADAEAMGKRHATRTMGVVVERDPLAHTGMPWQSEQGWVRLDYSGNVVPA